MLNATEGERRAVEVSAVPEVPIKHTQTYAQVFRSLSLSLSRLLEEYEGGGRQRKTGWVREKGRE